MSRVAMIPFMTLFLVAATFAANDWAIPHDDIEFDFSAFNYADIEQVYHQVIMLSRFQPYNIPILAQQTGQTNPPPRWLLVTVRGRASDVTTLAIRQDNLYLAGFTDKMGTWYTFANTASFNLIPGAIALDFSDRYSGLVGIGGWRNLYDLKVGRESCLRAIDTLSNYIHSPQADEGCLARAVTVLVVTICEANRFRPIYETIKAQWETGVFLGRLDRFVVNWKRISCGILVATQNRDKWGSTEANQLWDEHIGVDNLQQAKNAIYVILWPKDEMCSEHINWLPAH